MVRQSLLLRGDGRQKGIETYADICHRYIKSDMLKSLTDDVIDETCNRFDAIPDGCTWLFEFTGGGAQADVSDSCYPQSHREGMFTVAALHQWAHDEPPALDTRCVTTAEEWINEVIKPSSTGGPLPCVSRRW